MLRRSALVLLLACAACAPDRPADGAEDSQRADASSSSPDAQGGPAYLVWSADSATAGTVWIDGAGKVVARRPGIFVAGSGGVWEWREGKKRVSGLDCECLRNTEFVSGARCQTQDSAGTAELAELLSGRRVTVLEAKSDSGEAVPVQHATPLAGAGPYLFVESSIAGSACGAHGWMGVDVEVRDLSRGGAVAEIVDSVGAERVIARVGDEARGALQREYHGALGGGAIEPGDTLQTDAMKLSAVRAAWTPAGTLDVRFQLTTDACYACSDAIAGSYTRSVILPADSVPPPLRPFVRAPDVVRAYWRSAPPAEHAGWSQVDAADPAAALAAFRRSASGTQGSNDR
jgi:hypothetical protein